MTRSTPDPADLELAVQALRKIFTSAERYRRRAAELLGLSMIETYAISHLMREGPMPQGQLADRLGVSSGGATAMVDRLERAGAVRRRRDPHDRRRQVLEVTPLTRDRAGKSGALLAEVFSDVDPARLGQLGRDLGELADALERDVERMDRVFAEPGDQRPGSTPAA